MSAPVHFKLRHVLHIREHIVTQFGGTHGVRDVRALTDAIVDARSMTTSDHALVAATFLHGVLLARPFFDGNEQTALAIAGAYLYLNGHNVTLDPTEWTRIIRETAEGRVLAEDLATHFRREIARAMDRAG